jgi:HSP20 family molecular chaperone IbpA
MAQPQRQLDYAANVERYASTVDATAVKGIVKYLGIALHHRDSYLVAARDLEELTRVRDSFMKKKLGLTQTDAELDAALKDVMTTMSGEHNKSRVTVYYLLAEKFGKLGLFGNLQPATAMQPTTRSVLISQPISCDLSERIQHLYGAIARRAFEIFENNGRRIGNELGDWFRAESELLHPVHLEMTEADDSLGVRAEVPGFEAQELEIDVEPRRLTLSGNHEAREESKKGKTIYSDRCARQILRVVNLPAEVDNSKVTATLKDGILSIQLPKSNGAVLIKPSTA